MTRTVFVDGAEGTTGLEIVERLSGRAEFELLTLPEGRRKDADARREAFAAAEFAILCLPDGAAREAVALAAGQTVRLIDASSAHRVADGWTYGFPELVGAETVAGAVQKDITGILRVLGEYRDRDVLDDAVEEFARAPQIVFGAFVRLFEFLDHWRRVIEAALHSVRIAHERLIRPAEWRAVDGIIPIQ